MSLIAVLTTDIVDSTKLSSEQFERVTSALQEQLSSFQDKGVVSHFELYRGDSAQAILPNPHEALKTAFILKTAVNRLDPTPEKKNPRGQSVSFDLRVALGLGEAASPEEKKMTNEEPFIRSGKELDRITQNGAGVGVSSGVTEVDRELATELYLYEWIMNRWSLKVARVVYQKLCGLKEREIAEEMGISQSAVNQRSHAAHWHGLQRMLNRYAELLSVHYG